MIRTGYTVRYSRGIARLAPWGALLVAICALLLVPQHVEAHAAFERSDPAQNAIVPTAPVQITIWFTEPLEHPQSTVQLFDSAGTVVPVTIAPGPTEKALAITPTNLLADGSYSVAWRTLSTADGHPASGYFVFTVGNVTPITVAPPAMDDSPGAPVALQTIARWLVYLGLAGAVAIWPIWLLVIRPSLPTNAKAMTPIVHWMKRAAYAAIGLAMLGNVVALVVQAENLTGSFGSRVRETLLETRFGELWMLRIALLIVLGLSIDLANWVEPAKRQLVTVIVAIISVALPLPVSLNAHAAVPGNGRAAAVAADLVHMVAASLWIGGLALLVALLLPRGLPVAGDRWGMLAQALPRFSLVALTAWGAMIVTGIYSSWLHVGSLRALRETDYGQSLIIKVALVVLILPLAALNSFLVTRRLPLANAAQWRRRGAAALGAEVALALLVLLIAGRLTSQQPARDAIAAESGSQTYDVALNERSGELTLTPGGVGPNHYQLAVSGDALPANTEALLRVKIAGRPLGEQEIPLARELGNTFSAHGSELGIAGDRTVQVIVREIGGFQYSGSLQVLIGTGAALPVPADPAPRFSTGGIAGLLLLMAGLAALATATRGTLRTSRRESIGLGSVLLAAGIILMLGSRVEPSTTMSSVALAERDPAAIERGRETYLNQCASCHGEDGRGNGPAAAGLDPPPANLTGGHMQAHSDEQILGWIKNGLPPSAMPAFEGVLTDEQIMEIIAYLRANPTALTDSHNALTPTPASSEQPAP